MTDDVTPESLSKSTFEQLSMLRDTARWLSDISASFADTGNHLMASELFSASKDIYEAAETIRGNNAHSLNIEIQRSEEATANMLGAALASIRREAMEGNLE